MCLGVSVPESPKRTSQIMHKRCRDAPRCQVLGCCTDLTDAKLYYQRKLLCPAHMQADAVLATGSEGPLRFCFQCGKLQDLADFDANKRSCRRRLQQRRDNPRNKKGGNSRSSCSSATGAPAASTAAYTDCQLTAHNSETLQGLQASVSNAAALDELLLAGSAELSASCDPYLQLLQPVSPQSASAASGLTSSSEQGAWDTSSPLPHGAWTAEASCGALQQTGSAAQHSLRGFGQLMPEASAASSEAACWQPYGSSYPAAGNPAAPAVAAAVAAPALVADFGALQLPPLEDLLSEGVSDADCLQWVLESELTAAALDAAIANRNSVVLDHESQQLSQHLAAVLVQDSGLFGPSTSAQPMQAQDSGLFGPSTSAQPMQGLQHGQQSCTMPLGAHMAPAAPAGGALYSQHSVVASTVSCSSSMDFGAKIACSSPAACWGATGVLGSCMPCAPAGQLLPPMHAASACSGNFMPAQVPTVADCFAQPGVQQQLAPAGMAGFDVAMAGTSVLAGQAARLTQLRMQMADLQSRVAALRQQLGL